MNYCGSEFHRFWMDYLILRKIILCTGVWNVLMTICTKSLSLWFRKLKIANAKHRLQLVIRVLCNLNYLFCSIILALNLSTVSNVRFSTLLSNPTHYPFDALIHEYIAKESPIENIFVFVISMLIFYSYTSFRNRYSEFHRNIFLIFFFCIGYNTRCLGITFFIGATSNLFQVTRTSIEVSLAKVDSCNLLIYFKNILSLLLMCLWLYLFAFLVPFYGLVPVLLTDASNFTSQFHFNSFKLLFVIYYIAEVSHSPLANHIYYDKKLEKFYKTIAGIIRQRNFVHSDSEKSYSDEQEETLKMYTAQGKSIHEIRRQMELMQMVKCVMAIRKKLKRNKENRERIASKDLKDDRNGVNEKRIFCNEYHPHPRNRQPVPGSRMRDYGAKDSHRYTYYTILV